LIVLVFQTEDVIRHRNVTGVQTCALPISETISFLNIPIIKEKIGEVSIDLVHTGLVGDIKDFNNTIEFTRAKNKTSKEIMNISRSEERRVGKEKKDRLEKDVK